jgi:PadR family transcriptional regulator, regulatory protein PadR
MSSPRLPTVSRKEALILDLLAGAGDRYGLELVEASEGRLKRGTVYVTLSRMEDKGYVTSSQEAKAQGAIGLPRRVYRLTALGRRAREAWELVSKKLAWENA